MNGVNEMRSEPPQGVSMFAASSSQSNDFALKELSPFLGGERVIDKLSSIYDLVEPMHFLFVKVVRARDLPSVYADCSLDPFVEVRVGKIKVVTRHLEKSHNPEWNTVFTFSKERMQSSVLEVVVKDKDIIKDDFIGLVWFDLREIPTRVLPDAPLAPEWCRLENRAGQKLQDGELMLAVWMGTQADEAFADAWHSDADNPVYCSGPFKNIGPKVYHSPRLCCVRVNVIEAQGLVLSENSPVSNVNVEAQIGNRILKTKPVESESMNVKWNEDLLFVAAEPIVDPLVLTVVEHLAPNKDKALGRLVLPLTSVGDHDRIVQPRWFNLQKPHTDEPKDDMFASRVNLRVCLEGGYHALDESAHYSSDFRALVKSYWKTPIGTVELGILNADALVPVKSRNGRGTSDTFCIAKYGRKWIRTRTITDSLNPKYNEVYTWEVFDLATVLTVGVFDNGRIGERGSDDMMIGKVRIRVSTLENDRVHTHSYPLLVVDGSGAKKTGELRLAIRFSCAPTTDTKGLSLRPPLRDTQGEMPLTVAQLGVLRRQAVRLVAARLSRADPPLEKEVVEFMSDADSSLWIMRPTSSC